MGCFEVSCGLSNITIKHGDKAGIVLLIPHTEYPNLKYLKGEITLKPDINFVTNHGPFGLYQPFCLPIFGEYNDYGSLENIRKDSTVKKLEEYFEIPIKSILDIVGKDRSIWDSYAGILGPYGTGLKIEYSSDKITKQWLVEAGFEEKDGKYIHTKIHYVLQQKPVPSDKVVQTDKPIAYVQYGRIKEDKDEERWGIFYWNYETKKYDVTWASKTRDFCESFYKHSSDKTFFGETPGIMLGIKEEYWARVILLRKLSGMFIDSQVYNKIKPAKDLLKGSYMDKHIMEYLGFKYEQTLDKESKIMSEDDILFSRSDDTKIIYSHPDAPNNRFSVSGSAHNLSTDILGYKDGKVFEKKGKYTGDYWSFNPTDLKEKMKKYLKVDLDISVLEPIHPLQNKIDKVREFFEKEVIVKKKIEEMKESKEKDKLEFSMMLRYDLEDRESKRFIFGYLNMFPLIKELYKDAIMSDSKEFKDEYLKLYSVIGVMYDCNLMFRPSAHHHQHGEYDPQLKFNKLVNSVLVEKKKANDQY